MAVCQGSYFTFSIFYVAILEEFHWTRASTAGVFSLATLLVGFCGLLVGWLGDRWGTKNILYMGIFILALAMAALSTTSALWQIYLYYSIIGALGMGATGGVPHSTILSNWFVTRRGFIMGLSFSGMGVGMITLGPSSQFIISNLGWRSAYLILALIVLILLPLNLLFMSDAPKTKREQDDLSDGSESLDLPGKTVLPYSSSHSRARSNYKQDHTSPPQSTNRTIPSVNMANPSDLPERGEKRAGSSGGESSVLGTTAGMAIVTEKQWTLKKAFLSFKFWALFSAIFFTPVAIFPIFTHQVAYAVDMGFDKMLAASVFGILGLMSTLGRILFGSISDRIGRHHAAALSFLCSFTGVVLLMIISEKSQVLMLHLYAIFFGLGFGARGPITAAMAVDQFKGKSFGKIYGFLNIGNGLGGAIGPWLGGYIFDNTGSYYIAFIISIAGMIMATTSFYLFWQKTKIA